METGKTTKYFKYAIGEIVLVVIGILIALAINNWNEDRKKEQLKAEYLISLKNDYIKDTVQLNERIRRNKERIETIASINNDIEINFNATLDEFVKLLRNRLFKSLRTINTYNSNSFNLLISSGNIGLLNKEFQDAIMELNRLQLAEQRVSSGNRDYWLSNVISFTQKYPNLDTYRSNKHELLWNEIKTNELPKDIIQNINTEDYTIKRYIELSEAVLEETENVLNLIEDIEN